MSENSVLGCGFAQATDLSIPDRRINYKGYRDRCGQCGAKDSFTHEMRLKDSRLIKVTDAISYYAGV